MELKWKMEKNIEKKVERKFNLRFAKHSIDNQGMVFPMNKIKQIFMEIRQKGEEEMDSWKVREVVFMVIHNGEI